MYVEYGPHGADLGFTLGPKIGQMVLGLVVTDIGKSISLCSLTSKNSGGPIKSFYAIPPAGLTQRIITFSESCSYIFFLLANHCQN